LNAPILRFSPFMKLPASFKLTGLVAAAILGASCTTSKQTMSLTPDDLTTPPHQLARADYPFDDGGHYVDAWAAEGARRYPASMDSDAHEEGRARRSSAALTARSKTAARSKSTRPTSRSESVTVTIKPGDSLYSLSRRHGVSVAAIKKANGLKSDLLRDGRRLVIPK
jgi:LysM repeat protein